MKLDELQYKTLQWSSDRGILTNGNITTQALKLGSEIGELMDNVAKDNLEAVKDDIGDCLVVLTNLANLAGTTLEECWEVAYNDIKDRKGFLNKNGTFIKESDAAYEELVAKHEPTIVEINYKHLRENINKYHMVIHFDAIKYTELYVELFSNKYLPMNLHRLFVDKTKKQLVAYLQAIGKVEEVTHDKAV